MLPLLDELHWSLFPSWKGEALGISDNPSMSTALLHVGKLIGKSSDFAVTRSADSKGDYLTYREWYQVCRP